MCTHAFSLLQETRVDLAEELQQSSRRRDDALIPALPVLDQVAKQVLLHTPRLPPAHLPNGIETGGDDLGAHAWVDKFLGELADYRGEHVGRGELVDRLGEGDEDQSDLELVIGEVSELSVMHRRNERRDRLT
jgi:hypothetical protein